MGKVTNARKNSTTGAAVFDREREREREKRGREGERERAVFLKLHQDKVVRAVVL